MSKLGGRLKYARDKKGWTQTYVCKKLGIPNSTLSGYERNYRSPDPDLLVQLAELYEVSTDWLLGRADDHNSNTTNNENPYGTDLKKVLEKDEKAHWGGLELTEEEKRILASVFRAVRHKDEEAAAMEEVAKKKQA